MSCVMVYSWSGNAQSRSFKCVIDETRLAPSPADRLRRQRREGSFALAFGGRVRNIHEPAFALSAGRKSFALKRILEAVLVILLGITDRNARRSVRTILFQETRL